jgi:hypothetical protein
MASKIKDAVGYTCDEKSTRGEGLPERKAEWETL